MPETLKSQGGFQRPGHNPNKGWVILVIPRPPTPPSGLFSSSQGAASPPPASHCPKSGLKSFLRPSTPRRLGEGRCHPREGLRGRAQKASCDWPQTSRDHCGVGTGHAPGQARPRSRGSRQACLCPSSGLTASPDCDVTSNPRFPGRRNPSYKAERTRKLISAKGRLTRQGVIAPWWEGFKQRPDGHRQGGRTVHGESGGINVLGTPSDL